MLSRLYEGKTADPLPSLFTAIGHVWNCSIVWFHADLIVCDCRLRSASSLPTGPSIGCIEQHITVCCTSDFINRYTIVICSLFIIFMMNMIIIMIIITTTIVITMITI